METDPIVILSFSLPLGSSEIRRCENVNFTNFGPLPLVSALPCGHAVAMEDAAEEVIFVVRI